MDLRGRLEELGRRLGTREAEHAGALEEARRRAEDLRAAIADALERLEAAAAAAGAPHLRVELAGPHPDEKHLRALQLSLARGRHRGVVTVKSRGEVTLVGPFKAGRDEGPCRTFPWEARAEIDAALGEFLERFLEQAATP